MRQTRKIKCKTCDKDCYTGKRGLCTTCWNKEQKEKLKINSKKERAKLALDKKRQAKSISMVNLQTLFQRFVRLTTEDVCASCSKPTYSMRGPQQAHGGHMIPKKNAKSTALLVCNIFNQCATCNGPGLYGAPLDLYNYGCKFWGIDIMELTRKMSRVSYSFSSSQRVEIFDYINERIEEAQQLDTIENKNKLLRSVYIWQTEQDWFKEIKSKLL